MIELYIKQLLASKKWESYIISLPKVEYITNGQTKTLLPEKEKEILLFYKISGFVETPATKVVRFTEEKANYDFDKSAFSISQISFPPDRHAVTLDVIFHCEKSTQITNLSANPGDTLAVHYYILKKTGKELC